MHRQVFFDLFNECGRDDLAEELVDHCRTHNDTTWPFGDHPEGILKVVITSTVLIVSTFLTLLKAHNTMCSGQVQFQFDGVDACNSCDVRAQMGDLTSGCGCGPIGHDPHNHLLSQKPAK